MLRYWRQGTEKCTAFDHRNDDLGLRLDFIPVEHQLSLNHQVLYLRFCFLASHRSRPHYRRTTSCSSVYVGGTTDHLEGFSILMRDEHGE